MFPEKPEALTELSSDELVELRKSIAKAAESDEGKDASLEELTAALELSEACATELETRAAKEDALAKLAVEDEVVEVEVEVEVEETPEAPAAEVEEVVETPEADVEEVVETAEVIDEPAAEVAATPAEEFSALQQAATGGEATLPATTGAIEVQTSNASVTVAADVKGFHSGQQIEGMSQIVDAFMGRHVTLDRGGSDGDPAHVLSFASDFDSDRVIADNDNAIENGRIIKDGLDEQAAITAGGTCVPCTPFYDMTQLSAADRPVRDCLASFRADRGCFSFFEPIDLSSVIGSVGSLTLADDEAGYDCETCVDETGAPVTGPTPCKSCLEVPCPERRECEIEMIYRCLCFSNVTTQFFPEHVAAYIEASLAHWAQVAETKLIDAIKGASIQVAASNYHGAYTTLLPLIMLTIDGYRSRYRAKDQGFTVLLPEYARSIIKIDMLRAADCCSGCISDADVDEYFRCAGVDACFYRDTPTDGDPQIWGDQADGPLLPYPPNVQWGLYPTGSFVHLDAGQLDMGLVRDSSLNARNKYNIFFESFEGICFTGQESYWFETPFCASGSRPGTGDPVCPWDPAAPVHP